MTELILVPIAAVEIPKAKLINDLPTFLISYTFISEGYLSYENSKIKKNRSVVRDGTKYDTKFDRFLAVICAAKSELHAA